jgi:1-deoxy-D-xylulose-5-phosphate reductoisomerase
MMCQSVVVLGATGSIGVSTLDVLARHPDRYRVYALTANTSVDAMLKACLAHVPRFAIMHCTDSADRLAQALQRAGCDTVVLAGTESMVEVVQHPEVDTVMAAIVGFAGLRPTLAAAEAGKRILLANKEALVSAGPVFLAAMREHGGLLLPIDSEHNAMFQCLPINKNARADLKDVEKILLTASGGPFRGHTRDALHSVTPAQACAHPNWSMGRKISVDSATLANKGLELAEACCLFDCTPDHINVVVHPQSIVHSLVRYTDGSVLAQMGLPDMRTAIAYGLSWPERIVAGVDPLDLLAIGRLDFEAPDLDAFPCLRLAAEAARVPGAMCVFNAANEIAVAAFLEGMIRFTEIDKVIEKTLAIVTVQEPTTLREVEALDKVSRDTAQACIARGLQ